MNKLGVWIDHKKAVMVFLNEDRYRIEHVKSDAENHYRPSGGWKSSGTNVAQSIVKEKTAEERRKHQYHEFYKKIIDKCGNVGRMYIFGPSEAKIEFKKELGKIKNSPITIDEVAPSDKLTDHEVLQKVKSFYHVM